MSSKLKSIAVLIDADNASPKNIGSVLKEIEKLGSIRCKKLFGDWSGSHIQGWRDAWLAFAIKPIQQPAYAKGKNATDIGMVIEAMDLLYSGDYDGFCIVSSDSDFTALSLRIREDNVKVFGFGNSNTVEAFTQSCDQFFYVEGLSSAQETQYPLNTASTALEPAAPLNTPKIEVTNKWEGKRLKSDTKLLNSLRTAIMNQQKTDSKEWVNLAVVAQELKNIYPEFSPKNYGYKKVSELIKQIDIFETKLLMSSLYVRCKTPLSSKGVVPILSTAKPPVENKVDPTKQAGRWTTEQLQSQTHLISIISKLIQENPNKEHGWSNISYIANQINQHHKNVKLGKYGYAKFSDLLKALNRYDISHQDNKVLIRQPSNSSD